MINRKELLEKSIKIAKEHKLEIGSVLGAMTFICVAKEARKKYKKEKGVPENYEADASNILKKCDWIEVAQ